MKFVPRRRKFLSLVGGVAAWPLAANAQRQTGKLPTIGILGVDVTAWGPWAAASG